MKGDSSCFWNVLFLDLGAGYTGKFSYKKSPCAVHLTDMHFFVCMSVFNLNRKFVFSKSHISCKRKNLWKFASFSESMINSIGGLSPLSQDNGSSEIPHSQALPRPNFWVWVHDEPGSLSLTPRPIQGPGAANQTQAKESRVTRRWWWWRQNTLDF